MVIKGNTSGSILSQAFEAPCKILSYSFVNRTAGSINVQLGIVEGGVTIYVNYQTLAANAAYQCDIEIQVKPGWEILVVTSGSLDYYLTID